MKKNRKNCLTRKISKSFKHKYLPIKFFLLSFLSVERIIRGEKTKGK